MILVFVISGILISSSLGLLLYRMQTGALRKAWLLSWEEISVWISQRALVAVSDKLAEHGLPVLVFLLLGFIGLSVNKPFESPFMFLEYATLILVGAISTYNYIKTAKQLKEISVKASHVYLPLFILSNSLWFIIALVWLKRSEVHILAVALIYFSFSLANIRQVDATTTISQATFKKKIAFTVFSASWLSQENGPSALGFTMVLLFILVIPRSHSPWLEGIMTNFHEILGPHKDPKDYCEAIKGFTGGVATFHLALSVIKYALVVGAKDITECAIHQGKWDGKAQKEIIMRSGTLSTTWKVITLVALVFSFVLFLCLRSFSVCN